MRSTSMRSTLGRVRHLGSAKEGAHHWWMQRLTALALVPLVLWFVVSVAGLSSLDYPAALVWIGSPSVAVTLVLLIGATFYHAQLGLQVVIEDYIHNEGLKLATLVLVKFAVIILAVASIFAVLKIAFGG
ncbi:succinate dehydrogenase, hydrophobic membrane anchor protein [Thalassobaculum sp. OXR-137]|uniref:succinate dehydrogenase, hydrophobic membrane anchor protein n=1 Tax=Thalassobaculum sp. OXR-137 TaxID=3100173 RepID=UPI002AC91A9F|nr:succinate dehydrogenase, hydrophobic membrane anchor protein [Thalassobaculum sp. OXR-137]WPZ35392.1 succinate dehydrogenase, hydrophobic membrane anchor protein [Thalassobaculum sp. OXR-137]